MPLIRLRAIALAVAMASTLVASSGYAADHRDGSDVRNDPAADINDLYAWMSPDARRVNLAMTVFPFASSSAEFSDSVQYVFHTASADAFGGNERSTDIICSFDTNQVVDCWIGDDRRVVGDATNTAGLVSDDGRVRVFGGPRNDPFFFNLDGFNATTDAVVAAAGDLTFDDAGCPLLDAGTSNALVMQLQSDGDGSPATDDFAGATVLVLVVSVDKEILVDNGAILSVWASTHAR